LRTQNLLSACLVREYFPGRPWISYKVTTDSLVSHNVAAFHRLKRDTSRYLFPLKEKLMPRLLYVDDDSIAREITQVALQQIPGLDVVIAGSGTEALALATNGNFDLIVLDLVMPDINGLEVLKALRGQISTRGTAAAFATAREVGDEYQEMIQMGVTCILKKPLGPSALQREIKSLLELAAA
jgi:CheY-like chemotaxis protein